MSDSDDDLLALAGIGSDEEIQGDESDYEPEIKTSRSRTSATSRRMVDNSDEEEDDDDDDDAAELDDDFEQDPYPLEGKFKDDDDKVALLAMDEITREGILYEREQERNKYTERKFLALRARQDKAETSTLKKKGTASSKRLRTSKLSELKRQREKKNKRESRRYNSDDDDDLNELMDHDEELDDMEGDSDEGYESDEIDTKRRRTKTEDYDDKFYRDASLSDINFKVRSSRSVLSKFIFRDEFDIVIPGTYLRVNIGMSRETGRPQYRMCKLEEVKRGGRRYELLGKPCDTYLLVSQGESKKIIDIRCVSDSPIPNEEFEIYKRRLTESTLELPSLGEVESKFKELKAMSSRKLTDSDINKMVAKKEAISIASMESGNRVKRLQILREELQVAVEHNQIEKADSIQRQIAELSKFSNPGSSSNTNLSKMDKINLRNKRTNETSIRRAEKLNVGIRQKQLLSKSFNDPFSRLRTNAKLFYTSEHKEKKAEDAVEEKEEEEKKETILDSVNCEFKVKGIDSVIKEIEFDIGFAI